MNDQHGCIQRNKRTATAIVVLLAAMVPAAFAQAADVSVYGAADIAYSNVDWGQKGTTSFLNSGGESGSWVGFNASQDLGNGLTAKANYEGGVNLSNGTYGNLFYTRQAWAALSGGFGSITAGQDFTLTFLTTYTGEPCGWCGVSSYQVLTYGGGYALGSGNAVRAANYVHYNTPKFSGFSAGIGHVIGGDTTHNGVGDQTDVAGFYSKDAVNLAGSYRTTKLSASENLKDYYLAGNVGFGMVTVYALLGAAKSDGVTNKDERYTFGAVTIKVGGGNLGFKYGITKDKTLSNDDSKLVSVMYYYLLGKGTTVYAQASKVSNDTNAARSFWVGDTPSPAPVAGHDVKGFQVGLRYVFGG